MNEYSIEELPKEEILRLAVDIVAAYVSRNQTPTGQVPEVIHTVFDSFGSLDDASGESRARTPKPAVSIRRSVTPDFIVCLEDGKKLKMLKRHLRTAFNLTPGEYRAKWNLPPDYPMVAPNYSQRRSQFAKDIGLGRKKSKKAKRKRG